MHRIRHITVRMYVIVAARRRAVSSHKSYLITLISCLNHAYIYTETTANALAFAVYLLSTHPEAERCLLAEVSNGVVAPPPARRAVVTPANAHVLRTMYYTYGVMLPSLDVDLTVNETSSNSQW